MQFQEVVEAEGHLIDSHVMEDIFDKVVEYNVNARQGQRLIEGVQELGITKLGLESIHLPHAFWQSFSDAVGEKGKITLRTMRDGACIKVEIADTGPGIPPAARAHGASAYAGGGTVCRDTSRPAESYWWT